MATYNNGILGPFSGTIGNGRRQFLERNTGDTEQNPFAKISKSLDLQEQQRARVSLLISKFLQPLTDLLNQTFKKSAVG